MNNKVTNTTTQIPKYVSGKVAKSILGVSTNTLRNWANTNRIGFVRNGEKGKRFYDIGSLCKETTLPQSDDDSNDVNKKRTYCYCRVSTRNQKDDLQRQIDSVREKYPDSVIIQDIASGVNWKRKGLLTLIQQVKGENVEQVIICYKDRLCRFAFELIEAIFELYGVKIVVLNNDEQKYPDAEMAEDILSIIHIFSCKAMGKRRYKKKTDEGN